MMRGEGELVATGIDPLAAGLPGPSTHAIRGRASRNAMLGAGRCVAWGAVTLLLGGTSPLVLILLASAVLWTWGLRRREAISVAAWLEHLLAMAAAMYVGMAVYMAVGRPVLAALAAPAAPAAPAGLGGVARYSGMLLSMAAGMSVLMRVEGHDWRMCAEMTAAMIAPVIACFALVGIGIDRYVPPLSWLNAASVYDAAHAAMLLGMIALMAFRRAMYGSAASPACC